MIRREFLKGTLASTLTTPLLGAAAKAKNEIKVAFITDVHLEPTKKISQAGFEKVLEKIAAEKPDVILNGGDSIFDALERNVEETKKEWSLWKSVSSQAGLDIKSCIGNHDIWGWFLKDPDLKKNALYGKQWALEELSMPGRYYSFDKGNWHFIILDSIQPHSLGYEALIDDEQLNWLKEDLKLNAAKPSCLLSHVPLTSFCWQFAMGAKPTPDDILNLKRAGVVTNALALKDIFYENKNVKLCLGGHLHMQEALDYLGVKYLTCGAVSGNWWKGNRFEFKPSYTMLTLRDNGTFSHEWIPY